jgi:hypothetical protein
MQNRRSLFKSIVAIATSVVVKPKIEQPNGELYVHQGRFAGINIDGDTKIAVGDYAINKQRLMKWDGNQWIEC